MASKSDSSSQTVLLVIILIITFPIWIAVFGALFGVAVGLFGAVIGVIAAIFGAAVAIIVLPFKLIFGWGHGGWHWFPHFHGFWMIAIIIIAALIVRGRTAS